MALRANPSILLLAALPACAGAPGSTSTSGACGECGADTSADTGSPQPASTGPVAAEASGACEQGDVVRVQLGARPLLYAVEVQYEGGLAEPMQPDLYLRPSLLTLEPSLEDYESPLYRDSTELVFSCGYAWEASGPRIDGQQAGPAVGYRVTWLLAG